MSKNDELSHLQNLVDTCFDKLSKYNYSLHNNYQLSSRDSSTVIGIPSPGDSSIDIAAKQPSKLVNFVSSAKSKFHHLKILNHPDEITAQQTRRLESRYKQHVISLETFFTTYMSKLEQKYLASAAKSNDSLFRPVSIDTIVECDTYSYTILKIDAYYWCAAGLREHEFVKKGGRWYQEVIDRIQARALQYLEEYETTMKLAPAGAMRVVLLPEKTRMRIQKNRLRMRWRLH